MFKVGDIIRTIPRYHIDQHYFLVLKHGIDRGFKMYYLTCISGYTVKEEYTQDYAHKYFQKVS